MSTPIGKGALVLSLFLILGSSGVVPVGAAAVNDHILFSAGSSIFSVRPDGDGYRKLASEGSLYLPEWSPRKDKIVFTRAVDNDVSVWVMDADGTNERRVTQGGGAVWSPDGTRLAFLRSTASETDPLATRNQLLTVKPDGSDERVITEGPDGSPLGDLDWSPDGTHIAFVTTLPTDDGNPITYEEDNSEIYSVRVDTGAVVRLTDDVHRDEDPQWSPDGEQIAFVSDRDDELCDPQGGGCPYTTEIYLMRSDGSNEVRFTKNARRHDRSHEWAPDGRAIAWSQTVDDDVNTNCCEANILIKALDGSRSRKLTDDNPRINLDPSWSPDGRWLVFMSWREGSQPDLFKIRRDGTGRSRITRTDRGEAAPDW